MSLSLFNPVRVVIVSAALVAVLSPAHAIPFGANNGDTSLYALGDYVMNVVFLQDDQLRDPNDILHPEVLPGEAGSVIHFTPDELLAQQQAIQGAVDFWNNHPINQAFHPAARLNITVNFVNAGQPLTVPDAGTPMGIDADLAGYADALALIDPAYAGMAANPAARQFSHDTRVAYDADFAFTTFVRPLEPRTASASLNGPNINAYLDSNTYVHAHEIAHIFGALDQYTGQRNDSHSGYLDITNTNAATLPNGQPNPDHVETIMSTFGLFNFSDDTLGQIGWRDTDSDTIPDILDTYARLFAPGNFDDPFGSTAVDLAAGTLDASFFGIVNPLQSPQQSVSDATINTLASLQYRLDRGHWIDLLPADGTTNDAFESYALQLTGLDSITADGGLLLDLRLTNSVGNTAYFAKQFGIPEPATLLPMLALATLRRRKYAN